MTYIILIHIIIILNLPPLYAHIFAFMINYVYLSICPDICLYPYLFIIVEKSKNLCLLRTLENCGVAVIIFTTEFLHTLNHDYRLGNRRHIRSTNGSKKVVITVIYRANPPEILTCFEQVLQLVELFPKQTNCCFNAQNCFWADYS